MKTKVENEAIQLLKSYNATRQETQEDKRIALGIEAYANNMNRENLSSVLVMGRTAQCFKKS